MVESMEVVERGRHTLDTGERWEGGERQKMGGLLPELQFKFSLKRDLVHLVSWKDWEWGGRGNAGNAWRRRHAGGGEVVGQEGNYAYIHKQVNLNRGKWGCIGDGGGGEQRFSF